MGGVITMFMIILAMLMLTNMVTPATTMMTSNLMVIRFIAVRVMVEDFAVIINSGP